jgi:hypothetical protein
MMIKDWTVVVAAAATGQWTVRIAVADDNVEGAVVVVVDSMDSWMLGQSTIRKVEEELIRPSHSVSRAALRDYFSWKSNMEENPTIPIH